MFEKNKKKGIFQYGVLFVAIIMIVATVGVAWVISDPSGTAAGFWDGGIKYISNSDGEVWEATWSNIQRASDNCSSKGWVRVPARNYTVDSILYLNTNMTYYMDGVNISVPAPHGFPYVVWATRNYYTIITNKDHNDGDGKRDHNIHIIGEMYLDYGGDANAGDNEIGIWLHDCVDSTIEKVTVDNVHPTYMVYAYGIFITNCTDTDVIDCEGNNCGYEGIGIQGTSERCFIIDSSARNSANHAMQIASRTGPGGVGIQEWTPRNCGFIRCTAYTPGDDIIFHGPPNNPLENCIMQDCYGAHSIIGEVRNCTVRGGIAEGSQKLGFGDANYDNSHNVRIRNVDVFGFNGRINFNGYGENNTLENINLIGCMYDDYSNGGFWIEINDDGGDSKGIKYRNITIDNCDVASSMLMTIELSDAYNGTVVDNIQVLNSDLVVSEVFDFEGNGYEHKCRNFKIKNCQIYDYDRGGESWTLSVVWSKEYVKYENVIVQDCYLYNSSTDRVLNFVYATDHSSCNNLTVKGCYGEFLQSLKSGEVTNVIAMWNSGRIPSEVSTQPEDPYDGMMYMDDGTNNGGNAGFGRWDGSSWEYASFT